MRLTKDQRGRIAEKVMEWGNLVFVGLVIAQFVPELSFNFVFLSLGIIANIVAYIFAYWFMRGGGRR